jgi:hypothetical protein
MRVDTPFMSIECHMMLNLKRHFSEILLNKYHMFDLLSFMYERLDYFILFVIEQSLVWG